jgi:hypothetical protein
MGLFCKNKRFLGTFFVSEPNLHWKESLEEERRPYWAYLGDEFWRDSKAYSGGLLKAYSIHQ